MTLEHALKIAATVFAGTPIAGNTQRIIGILWHETGYPSFFSGDADTCLREQLAAYRERVCDGNGHANGKG